MRVPRPAELQICQKRECFSQTVVTSAVLAVTEVHFNHRIEIGCGNTVEIKMVARSWAVRCGNRVAARECAMNASAVAHSGFDSPTVRVLALLEATRVTGVARNVVEHATRARQGVGGVRIETTLALIRRGPQAAARTDLLRRHAMAAGVRFEVLVERYRYDRRILASLRRLFEAERPTIVETHHVKSHLLVALSGLWRQSQWVAFHHGYTQTDLKVRTYNQVDRWSLGCAAHVVTTNEAFAATIASRGVARDRITVLHNGVEIEPADPAAVSKLRRRLGLAAHERVVLAVGRLSREKGQGYLVRAAAAWRHRARLVIVGDGPDRRRLERLAARLGVGGQIIFAGMTSTVADFYALADVFVLPSLSEGSPNVLLEAMASGTPAVATRVGGVPEIARDGVTALLGEPKDPDFLARSVLALLDDRGLAERLAAAARASARDRFTHERRVARLCSLYGRLVGTPSAAAEPCVIGRREPQTRGSAMTADALPPSADDQIDPPWALMIRRAIARLRPVPPRHSSNVVSESAASFAGSSIPAPIAIQDAGRASSSPRT